MFTRLNLRDFKSFAQAELRFGRITTIIGANAAGKSNIRDALKFLHATGRGLTLPEIFGGKSSVGWSGIRGGAPGTVRTGMKRFQLEFHADPLLTYRIEVSVTSRGPLVSAESLSVGGSMIFESVPSEDDEAKILDVRLIAGGDYRKGQRKALPAHQPMLSQVVEAAGPRTDSAAKNLTKRVNELRGQLSSIRFIDFSPPAMRQPSVPGETTISETGDNLSSVLRYLVEDQKKESVLASWIKALTPMDVSRIGFEEYPDGKILALLEEGGGRKVPISSASDGTLRFLGILASVLSPEAPTLLCFEEIETGLHPVRVQLVSELLQKNTSDGKAQVMLTTHSPGLLGWLGRDHRENAYLAYRLANTDETRLKAFSQIGGIEQALEAAEASRLFESGWFEEAMYFAEGKPEAIALVNEEKPTDAS